MTMSKVSRLVKAIVVAVDIACALYTKRKTRKERKDD